MRVHVCIPHFAREEVDLAANPQGYGSLRVGAIPTRSSSEPLPAQPLEQQRYEITVLNIHHNGSATIKPTSPPRAENQRMHHGEHQLNQARFIRLEDRSRAVAARNPPRTAIGLPRSPDANRAEADLLMYMEDDLVIHDPAFFDKQRWFLEKTDHRFCLMPHRYEPVHQASIHQLLVDGPLSPQFIGQFMQPQANAAHGVYGGRDSVNFDLASNPHSGCFVVSAQQAEELSQQPLPREGFVGPLETAATLRCCTDIQ